MNTLTRKLVAREFLMHRWLIGGSTLAGLASLAVVARGGHTNFNIGFVIWLTTIAAFGAVIAMFGVATERKERVRNWVLSLPISHGDYVRIKAIALVLCYFACWLVLSAGALGVVALFAHLPDGLLPSVVLLCVFLLANYALVLSCALHLHSEGPMTLVIIVHNIGITFFIFLVASLDGIGQYMQGPVAEWNTTFWTVLVAEIALFVLLLALPFFITSRRRDFV